MKQTKTIKNKIVMKQLVCVSENSSANECISSLDLVKQINVFRSEEGDRKELLHKTLLGIIRDEFDDEIRKQNILQMFIIKELPNGGSRKDPYFELTLNQAKQVLMRESKFVRKAMIQYIDNLENELRRALQPQSKLPSYAEALRELADKVEENEQLRIECNNEKERSSRLCGNNIAIAKRYCETIESLETSLGCYKDELEYKEREVCEKEAEVIAAMELADKYDKEADELDENLFKAWSYASKLKRENEDLKQYKQLYEDISLRESYASVPEVTKALPSWRGEGKIDPRMLVKTSDMMRLSIKKVVNQNSRHKNTINSYHKDVWMHVYGIDINFFAKTGDVEF